MSTPSNELFHDIFDDISVPSPTPSFDEYLEQSNLDEAFPNDLNLSTLSQNFNNECSREISNINTLEFDLNFASQDSINPSSQFYDLTSQIQFSPKYLQIIAQPCCAKVRSRKEYGSSSTRRDAMTNKTTNSSYKGPAIRIPNIYLNIIEQYYIGVCLVTVKHEKTNCRYIHPYELESIDYKDRNDHDNNIVWYPIEYEDQNGIKSFSDLRIVKKTEKELDFYGNLRPFNGDNVNLLNNPSLTLTSSRQLVREYTLKNFQLAFMIGKKININDRFPTIIDCNLTIFSEDKIETIGKEIDDNNEPSESLSNSNSIPSICCIYKYAPRRGYTEGNDEILLFFEKKLENKYGKLQITFKSYSIDSNWSEEIAANNIEVKGQMVSFKTPCFPFSIRQITRVKIIFQQGERMLEELAYFYLPKLLCSKCEETMVNKTAPIISNNPKKRSKSSLCTDADETDAIVPIYETKPEFRQTKSEPEPHSIIVSSPSANINQTNNNENQILDKIAESVTLLFTNNDFKPFLRICRSFIRKKPELLHQAIENNYSDLIINFISVAPIDLLRSKNEYGETVLLHAIRLNRFTIVKNLLEKENFDKFLEDVNKKGQNIFHILALNMNSDEILNFLINHLLKKSINIQEKFDYIDNDNNTPLQLSIIKSNIVCTQYFLKYFNNNIYKTNDNTGDNLIHLAVRYSDLKMLKYLLNEGQLINQGKETNLEMTPIELARSMKCNDMVEYFNEIYPQLEVDDDDDDDDDDDESLENN